MKNGVVSSSSPRGSTSQMSDCYVWLSFPDGGTRAEVDVYYCKLILVCVCICALLCV